jgi:hypothetical protein
MNVSAPLLIIAIAIAILATAACNNPSPTVGADRASGSNATAVTWSDGRQAYAITCSAPGGCQERALAMCSGNYSTLSSENMPTPGTVRSVQGPPSVVVRCR